MTYSNLDKDYSHTRTKPRGKKLKTPEHKRFESWLKERLCQVPRCYKQAEICHHAPFRSHGGTHDRQVGLCTPHHVDSKIGVHFMSRDAANVMMGCDIEELAEENWLEFKEQDK